VIVTMGFNERILIVSSGTQTQNPSVQQTPKGLFWYLTLFKIIH